MTDYRHFQQKNPTWPKRLSDAEGRLARLKSKLETRGGQAFVAGTVVRIEGHWRGRLSLKRLGTGKVIARGVHPFHVELLPPDHQPCELCEGIGQVHGFKPSKPHVTWIETCPRCGGSGQGRRASDLTESRK